VGQQLRALEEKIRRLKENPAATRKEHIRNLTERVENA